MSRQGSQCSKHVPGTRSHGSTRRLLAQEEGWNLILHQQDDLDFLARFQLLLRVLIERVRLVDLGTENILVVVGHPDVHLQRAARCDDVADESRLFTQFAQSLDLRVAARWRNTCTEPDDGVLDGLAILPQQHVPSAGHQPCHDHDDVCVRRVSDAFPMHLFATLAHEGVFAQDQPVPFPDDAFPCLFYVPVSLPSTARHARQTVSAWYLFAVVLAVASPVPLSTRRSRDASPTRRYLQPCRSQAGHITAPPRGSPATRDASSPYELPGPEPAG